MICDGCLCMSCKDWADCPMYARCEMAELTTCAQREVCIYYRNSEETATETGKNRQEKEKMKPMVFDTT